MVGVRVFCMLAVGAACFGTKKGAEEGSLPPSPVESSTSTTVLCGRSVGAVAGLVKTIGGDFDGDGRRDHAYQTPRPELMLGVCLATGQSDEVESGQAEGTFDAVDLDQDGRDEILFGGTSVLQTLDVLAAVVDGTIEVDDRSGPALASGPMPPDPEQAAQAWGCEDVGGDVRREVVQVTVRRSGPKADWTKEIFRVERARLVLLETRTGATAAQPNLTELATSLVPRC